MDGLYGIPLPDKRQAETLAASVFWQVVPELRAAPIACELHAEESLHGHDEPNGTVWESAGDHAGFHLDAPVAETVLPAGWYALHGRIERLGGALTLPSLRITFAHADLCEEDIPLSDPRASGRLSALVLFKYPVSDLRFCPGTLAARFRMHLFSLRRISRARALWMMLCGAGQGGMPWPAFRRAVDFLGGLWRTNLRAVTGDAYADYLQHQRPPGLSDYDVWIRKYDTFTPHRLAALQRFAGEIPASGAELSVLMPVTRDALQHLQVRIDSMRGQLWEGWELCLAADTSCDEATMQVLRDHAARDRRIRVAPGLSDTPVAAFNQALQSASGSHVVVVGEGAELRRHALLELAALRHRHPDLALAYADEDWKGVDGRRNHPYFKPDWNPDLLRSQDYIGPFAMIRRDLVVEAGGLRQGFGDSALHDLFLRCTERVQRSRVYHVPQILYHRREGVGPVLPGWDPSQIAPGGARAVVEHLVRLGILAKVDAIPGRSFRVHWPLPPTLPKVSIVIPTRDRMELLRTCVESILRRTTWPNYEIVIVDNQSSRRDTLDYLEALRGREHIRVLTDDTPFNYSAINNRAVAQCDGELVCLLNNDIEVITPAWLEEMAGHALRPEVGAVGAMLYYPNDTIQHAGVVIGLHGAADHAHAGRPRGWPGHGGRARVAQEFSAVTGACLLVRRTTYLEAGGLDASLAVAFNDIDFCLRLRERGLHNIWTPHAELYHHESASRGSDDTPERQARNAREIAHVRHRWAAVLRTDPAYNPNLSLHSRGSELAFPPRTVGHAACGPFMASPTSHILGG
jgi:GT2 family glycosyltransferase